jgi:hypothetical protein
MAATSMSSTACRPSVRQPEGWPPYYPPRLVRDLAGIDAVTGAAASIERAYVLHRIALEKVRVLDARAPRCDQDLGVCEQRVVNMAAMPSFWDSSAGRVLLISFGFLAGMSATAGIASVVEQGGSMAWKYCGEARECLAAQAPQGRASAVDAPFHTGCRARTHVSPGVQRAR